MSFKARIRIYNLLGQELQTLVDEEKKAGYHKIIWDGSNKLIQQVSLGVLEAEKFRATIIILKTE